MTHRATLAGAVGALVTAGMLVLGGPAAALAAPPPPPPPGPPGPFSGLTLSPTHGKPTAPIDATLRIGGAGGRCPRQASFFWDNLPVGQANFGTPCTARLQFTPPDRDRAPGFHAVNATADNISAGSAVYTVDLATTSSPSPSPSPRTPPPTTAAPTTAGAKTPSPTNASPTPTASTDDALPTAEAAQSPPAGGAGGPVTGPAVSPAPARLTAWALVFGGGLVLVGAVAMGLLFLSSRRNAAADTDTESGLQSFGLDRLMPARVPGTDTPTVDFPRPSAPEA